LADVEMVWAEPAPDRTVATTARKKRTLGDNFSPPLKP